MLHYGSTRGLTEHRATGLEAARRGWTLRQVAHHLAQAEMYYTVWLDEALPDEAQARYLAARERFDQRLYQLCVSPPSEQTALFRRGDHSAATIEQVAESVLASEQQLLAQECYS